jgi:hypothetical protein
MARNPSTMLSLGTPLPAFSLPDPARPGMPAVSSAELLTDKGLVVMFI